MDRPASPGSVSDEEYSIFRDGIEKEAAMPPGLISSDMQALGPAEFLREDIVGSLFDLLKIGEGREKGKPGRGKRKTGSKKKCSRKGA